MILTSGLGDRIGSNAPRPRRRPLPFDASAAEDVVVTGTVAFDVEPGTYYALFAPEDDEPARGVWEVTA